MQLLFGSFNQHKTAEIRQMLPPYIQLLCCADFPQLTDADETEDTLAGNALLKARQYGRATGMPCFADDTGLEVTALQGAPGVHSARYAGPHNDATANMHKLLQALHGNTQREAQFRTVIAYIDATGHEHLFEGILTGHIAHSPAGAAGFGYDPIFIPHGSSSTLAQHSPTEKNSISHRSKALQAFIQHLAHV